MQCLERAQEVAPLPLSVLISGPSGSGKEHIAALIHRSSGRLGPWVPVNCASLSPQLGESELFGYEKGAFTGATGSRAGLITLAEGGTLFLDEVAELDPRVQAKLLRFLEEKSFRPVGSLRDRVGDVRVVAATCRDLSAMINDGQFRGDLYERLAGYVLPVPSLKERPGDVIRLARHFLKTDAICAPHQVRLSRGGELILKQAPWPGNVRELRRVIRQIVLEEKPRTITSKHLANALGLGLEDVSINKVDPMEDILRVLRSKGSLGTGAIVKETGISRSTVQRHLKRLISQGVLERVDTDGRGRYRPTPPLQSGDVDVPEHLRRAMAVMGNWQSIRTSELAHAIGISSRTASRWLSQLVEMGMAEAIGGEHRGRRYRPKSNQPSNGIIKKMEWSKK